MNTANRGSCIRISAHRGHETLLHRKVLSPIHHARIFAASHRCNIRPVDENGMKTVKTICKPSQHTRTAGTPGLSRCGNVAGKLAFFNREAHIQRSSVFCQTPIYPARKPAYGGFSNSDIRYPISEFRISRSQARCRRFISAVFLLADTILTS